MLECGKTKALNEVNERDIFDILNNDDDNTNDSTKVSSLFRLMLAELYKSSPNIEFNWSQFKDCISYILKFFEIIKKILTTDDIEEDSKNLSLNYSRFMRPEISNIILDCVNKTTVT